jgi:hypothetical protein
VTSLVLQPRLSALARLLFLLKRGFGPCAGFIRIHASSPGYVPSTAVASCNLRRGRRIARCMYMNYLI